MELYDPLLLKNQICFPLYAVSKEITKRYRPYLEKLNLTYTQYITLMVLWEQKEISVKELGEELLLDSGTLTPLLKTMEQKGFLCRTRSKEDERVVLVTLTEKGEALKEEAKEIPKEIRQCLPLSVKDAAKLYLLLNKVLEKFREENNK
ncbi:MAG TPA: MarR family transcriptional regulator [Clostridiales bacterium]|nr:MarR family transcriptional regulator [Clostridiales bacterium]